MIEQRSHTQTNNKNQISRSLLTEFTSKERKAQIELLQLLVNKDESIRSMVKTKVNIDMFTHPLLQKLARQLLKGKMIVDTAAIIE